jgi:hypothetical protein
MTPSSNGASLSKPQGAFVKAALERSDHRVTVQIHLTRERVGGSVQKLNHLWATRIRYVDHALTAMPEMPRVEVPASVAFCDGKFERWSSIELAVANGLDTQRVRTLGRWGRVNKFRGSGRNVRPRYRDSASSSQGAVYNVRRLMTSPIMFGRPVLGAVGRA